jgi:hypothetical protein
MTFNDAYDIARPLGAPSAAELNQRLKREAEAAVEAIPPSADRSAFAAQAREALDTGDWRAAIANAEAAAERGSHERWA